MKEWKINILKIIDTRISFYSRTNTHLLLPKPQSFCHLKRGIQIFFMNYVLVPAGKAANNVVYILVSKLKKKKTEFLRCT